MERAEKTGAQCFPNSYQRSYGSISKRFGVCTNETCWMDGVRFDFPMSWDGSIGMLQRSGAASGWFPGIGAGRIQLQNTRDAIISIRV